MSTPATIVIKVRPEDIGKRRRCDISKINLRTYQMAFDLWKSMGHSDAEVKEILEESDRLPNMAFLDKKVKGIKLGAYVGVYHHWDGYPDSLGKELRKRYKDYDSALNLVLAGDYSTILDGSMPYAALSKRNENWKDNKPIVADELGNCNMNYQYLFDNGRWYYRRFGEKKFKVLR